MTPLLPPGSLFDDDGRPASRLEVQRHALVAQRMQYMADAAGTAEATGVPGGRLAALTGSLRDAVGTALIAAGERIRPYRPETAAGGTRAS
jgi:hypothetical protein